VSVHKTVNYQTELTKIVIGLNITILIKHQ